MPVLDKVQSPPRESIGVMHERETESEPTPERESVGAYLERNIREMLPDDMVKGGEKALDLIGNLGFVDFETGVANLQETLGFGDSEEDVGARLRRQWQAGREIYQQNTAEAAERTESDGETHEARMAARQDKTEKRMMQSLQTLSDYGLDFLEKETKDLEETSWRARVLEMISAERDRRAQ